MGNFCSELSKQSISLPATSLPAYTLKSRYPSESVEEHFNNICEDFSIINELDYCECEREAIDLFNILDIFITNHKIEEVIEIEYMYSLDSLFYITPILLDYKRIHLFYKFLEWTKPSKFLLAYSNNSERTPCDIREIMNYASNRNYAYKCVKLIWEHVDRSKRLTWSERYGPQFIERVECFLEK
jgi:hypothetical protein